MTLSGAAAEPGTLVSAHFAGIEIATATVLANGGGEYRIDVPGDRPETAEIEGPPPGGSFELRVAGAPVTTAAWSEGVYLPLDLEATAGADLSLSIDDGQVTVAAGQTVTITLVVGNESGVAATGTELFLTLPPDSELLAASDGGALDGGEVGWPAFAIAPSAVTSRTASYRLSGRFASGVETLVTNARVAHDGAAGGDPVPANDLATDLNALEATPDLVAAIDDGRTALRPGELAIYRVTVQNSGSQDASGVDLSVTLPGPMQYFSSSHGGQVDGGTVRFPLAPVAAGGTMERAVTARVPATIDSSIPDLAVAAAVVDDGANGSDSDPADNQAIDLDTLTHGPDLRVVELDGAAVAFDPQSFAVSGAASITVLNSGTMPAPAVTIALFEDLDRDGSYTAETDRLLGETLSPALAAADAVTLEIAASGVAGMRDARLFAMVDADRSVAEIDEENNVGSESPCAIAGSLAAMAPVIEMSWPPPGGPSFEPLSIDSISTPLVVQLTDDNGDGRWDEGDMPDLLFVTANLAPTFPPEPDIVLRAVRADTGESIWNVPGLFTIPISFFSLSGLAAGDLDLDGRPEIVTTVVSPDGWGFLQAYEHTGAFKWRSDGFDVHPFASGTSNRDNPSLADLEGDGDVEIVVGGHAFDHLGNLLWAGTGGQAYQTQRNNQLVGGAISVVADVDLDGRAEVVTGDTLYRHDGSIVWRRPESDGYPAVLQADEDPEAEIAVVSRGFVRLHDTDGTLLWGPLEMPGSDPESGGPPAIGDLDGDGSPEIVVAGSDILWALRADGTALWQASTRDYSSTQTGASLFDFDGDGTLEVVYRDERALRIYRGLDGEVLFEEVLSSTTMTELPGIADVDRDGNAEIVVTSDHAWDYPVPAGGRTAGLRVYGDANDGWQGARPVWNQHAYCLSNVTDAARIPARPDWSWLAHGTFRAGAPPEGLEAALSDVSLGGLEVDLSALPAVTVAARVGNVGPTPVAAGLEVALFDGPLASPENLRATGVVPVALAPGEFHDLLVSFDSGSGLAPMLTVLADAAQRERECDEANNAHSVGADVSALGLWVTQSDGTSSVAPGDTLTYSIHVHNAFAATATGVSLTDLLPVGAQFLGASHGGSESAGSVSWPAFALASGAVEQRTVTVRIDSALPLGVTSITNLFAVTDDGTLGPDPTPGNNQAIDINTVVSVVADAGGPYSAFEGDAVALDGSASFDRDGGSVELAWDLDGDGAFDDASGPSATLTVVDEGVRVVRLRAIDDEGEVDLDEATVTVGNRSPTVDGPAEIDGEEGGQVSLAGYSVTDAGASDTLLATIDWGDGVAEPVALLGGTPQATHLYADDGDYPAELCVDDADGGLTCLGIPARIANVPPEVAETETIEFFGWQREEIGGGVSTRWRLSGDGRTVTEELNGTAGFLVGDRAGYGTFELTLRVDDGWDDDFVGFAIGYLPGDVARAEADFLLIDWKRGHQTGAVRGLALSRVTGIADGNEYWVHQDLAANGVGNGVVELQRAATLGATGWAAHTTYRFRIESAPTRLRLFVDGRLELDYSGLVPAGRLALYDYSQARAVFEGGIAESSVVAFEGSAAAARVTFTDPGRLDSHTATLDWGDGVPVPADVVEEPGQGEILGERLFVDDAQVTLTACATDDDGDTGCGARPVVVENLPPVLALVVSSSGLLDEAVTLTGSGFSDPGTADTHLVGVDWGDGTVEPIPHSGSVGVWAFDASHLYDEPGDYTVRVCVEDDDGGEACDERPIALVVRALDLVLTKQVAPIEARPNQDVVYTLTVRNTGTVPAAGTTLADRLPPHLSYVSSSSGGVLAGGTVTWDLGTLAPGSVEVRTLTLRVDATAPYATVVTNSASADSDPASGPDAHPTDNFAAATLRFSNLTAPIVTIPAPYTSIEGSVLTLTGITWSDTSNQSHTGTISWGDGTITPATMSPGTTRNGTATGSHRYLEDGVYPIEVCVRDQTAQIGCTSTTATIANAPAEVIDPGPVPLSAWQVEEYSGSDAANWVVAADGLSVYQDRNSRPSIYLSPFPAVGVELEGVIRVESPGAWDDDFIGFVLGFSPGDSLSPGADFLLIDWKQGNQDIARRGLAVSRVTGAVSPTEFWGHYDHPDNGAENRVLELARAATLGNTGWSEGRDYRFRFEASTDRLRIWVDGVLQFDLAVGVPAGKFGFYNYSQEAVRYRGFTTGLEQLWEGDDFLLATPFVDPGVLDTHTGAVVWDDGESSDALLTFESGLGLVGNGHSFPDDGDFLVRVCVDDDDGGGTCGLLPYLVLNRPPVVTAAPNASARTGQAQRLELASFVDPGVLDSHAATVDWGDSVVEAAEVLEDGGTGTVSASHLWNTPGLYPVAVCVVDDEGDDDCATLEVEVLDSLPVLRAEKSATVIDRDGDGRASPGDDLRYRLLVANDGDRPAVGVTVTDPVPANTSLVPGSVFPAEGVISTEPVIVTFDPIDPGAQAIVELQVTIADPLPAGVVEIVNVGRVESSEITSFPTDDPALPGLADPTRTPVFASPGLVAGKSAALVDLDGDGVATPGDEIEWSVEVVAGGDTAAGGVLVQDAITEPLNLVAGSLNAPGGTVLSVDPIAVVYDGIEVGASVAISFRTAIAPAFPAELESVSNQAVVLATGVDAFGSDDPATPVEGDPTRVEVHVHPTIAIASASVAEGDAGTTTLAFPVTLDRAARLPATVTWQTEGITATPGADFVAAGGTVTIPAGATTAEIHVPVLGDLVVEATESVRVVLSDPVYCRIGQPEAIGGIENDDSVSISITDRTVIEGEVAAVTISLSAPSSFPVAVDFATVAGSASATIDYLPASGTISFAPLALSATVEIASLQDGLAEADERLFVDLSAPVGATLADARGEIVLLDDDAPGLTVADADVVEGNEGTVELAFRVALSAPSERAIEVDLATAAGTALPGSDFTAASERLVLVAGAVEAWFVVLVHGDLEEEADETLFVLATGADGATIVDGEAIGTLFDDDEAGSACLGPNLLRNGDAESRGGRCEVPDWSEEEGDWTILWSPASPAPFEGDAEFAGRRGGGDDLTLQPGSGGGDCFGNCDCDEEDDLQTRPASGLERFDGDDCDDEIQSPFDGGGGQGGGGHGGGGHGGGSPGGECFAELRQTVDLTAFANRVDLGAQEILFRARLRTEADEPTARVRVVLELRASSQGTLLETYDTGWLWNDVEWETVEATRLLPPGTRAARVRLLVDADSSSARGYFDGLELRPVDTTVVSPLPVFELEGHTGLHDAWVPLRVTCPVDAPITLDYATANGSARAPWDYLARAGTVAIDALSEGVEIPIPIVGDTQDEPAETFRLQLSDLDLADGVLFPAEGVVTILNDDFCRRSPGYWKTHRSSWPVDWLVLGAVEYDDDDLYAFLAYGGSDGSTRLARHLTATKLNLARGSDPWIEPTVTAADLFLAEHPPGSSPSGGDLGEANALKDELDAYNNSGCQVP